MYSRLSQKFFTPFFTTFALENKISLLKSVATNDEQMFSTFPERSRQRLGFFFVVFNILVDVRKQQYHTAIRKNPPANLLYVRVKKLGGGMVYCFKK